MKPKQQACMDDGPHTTSRKVNTLVTCSEYPLSKNKKDFKK